MKKVTSIKNFWSLNVDEAVVTGMLRSNTPKEIEVFMPLNAQMKDLDLVLVNTKNKKSLTIQVKGSRAYKGTENDIKRLGNGSNSWYSIKKETIEDSIVDYYIFLIYVIEQLNKNKKGRISIEPHVVIISSNDLRKKVKSYKKANKKNIYQFELWTNTEEKKLKVFDHRDQIIKGKKEYFTEFLDDDGFNKLNKDLK